MLIAAQMQYLALFNKRYWFLFYLNALLYVSIRSKVMLRNMYDVIIIGGGPAGLNAAMILGRARRNVVVFDSGEPRNRWSESMNGFLTSDGMDPKEFIKKGRAELAKYNVELIDLAVDAATYSKGQFIITDSEGKVHQSKKLLLATGLKDLVPKIEGIDELYGKSVHHCPYCDGWESRDKAIAVYGKDRDGIGLALAMKNWSSQVTLYTDNTSKLTKQDIELLNRNEVNYNTERIVRLEGENGQLKYVVTNGGKRNEQGAMFFSTGTKQQSILGEELGCEFTAQGVIKTRKQQKSNIPGLYVAGDAARDMQMVIVAAAEGAKAGVAINKELQQEARK